LPRTLRGERNLLGYLEARCSSNVAEHANNTRKAPAGNARVTVTAFWGKGGITEDLSRAAVQSVEGRHVHLLKRRCMLIFTNPRHLPQQHTPQRHCRAYDISMS